MYKLPLSSFGAHNAQTQVQVFRDGLGVVKAYDSFGNAPWTDNDGKADIYVEQEGSYQVKVGHDEFVATAGTSIDSSGVVMKYVTEAPAQGTPSSVISILLEA